MSTNKKLIVSSIAIHATILIGTSTALANPSTFKKALIEVIVGTGACDIGRIDTATLLVSSDISNPEREIRVIGIQTDSCFGGSDYQYTVQVYDIGGQSPLKIDMPDLSFPWIESIADSYNNDVPNITIVAPEYAPEYFFRD